MKVWAKLGPLLAPFILIAVIASVFVRDAFLLFSFPVPVGTDGFYYLNQVEAVRSTGNLCYPTATPLLLYVFGLLSRASIDPIVTIKMGALLLFAGVLIAAGNLVTALTHERLAGLTAATLIAISNTHLYFIVEFINNLGALCALLMGVALLLRGRAVAGAIALGIAGAVHSSVPAIVSIAMVIVVIAYGCTKIAKDVRLTAVMVLIVLAWAALTFSAYGTRQVSDPFSGDTAFDVILVGAASVVALALLLLSTDIALRGRSAIHIFILGTAIETLAITLNPFLDRSAGLESVGGRVSLLAHVQVAMVLPSMCFIKHTRRSSRLVVCMALCVVVIVKNYGSPVPSGVSSSFMSRRMHLVNWLKEGEWRLPSDSLVIASHGDQFLVSHVLTTASANRLPSDKDRAKVWWLVRRQQSSYAMIEDAKLEATFAAFSARDQIAILAANPHLRKQLDQGLDSDWNKMRYQ